MLRKFSQFLRNQPNNNSDDDVDDDANDVIVDELQLKYHHFIVFTWQK